MQGLYRLMLFGIPVFLTSKFRNFESTTEKSSPVVVSGSHGAILGTVIPEGGMFKGIPYSQPPTGNYRWKNPRDPLPYPSGVWSATKYGPKCMQPTSVKQSDEDCLYLNVWIPTSVLEESDDYNDVVGGKHYVISEKYQNRNSESLAVMVFIHGGTFISGAGSTGLYDGRSMASQGNVIIVTINYRLGAFGFLVEEGGAEGNYGIRDQIAALKWVQENIASFGGNPDKVTIFGESAGAESVGTLMSTEAAEGLFHRAIIESSPFALPYRDTENAEKYGAEFAKTLNCSAGDMECLQNIEPAKMVTSRLKTFVYNILGEKKSLIMQPWTPVIDGNFLKELPLNAFQNGRAMKIPVIMGTNQDEGFLFVGLFPTPVGRLLYRWILDLFFADKASDVEEKYPSTKDNRDNIGRIMTDLLFHCSTRAAASGTTSETWTYLFNQNAPMSTGSACDSKVCHGEELPYVFDTFSDESPEEDKSLSKRMVQYWTNFAKYGDPNGQDECMNEGENNAIYWPEHFADDDHSTYRSIKFEGSGDSVINENLADICDFWDDLALYGLFK